MVCKWTSQGNIERKTKKKCQLQLRENLGIVVDLPKSGGSGTSNDGNTARRFFRAHKEVAKILDINESLIKRLYIALCVLSANRYIDEKKLMEFNAETYDLYLSLYKWFNMPQAVHKMLAHSHQVVAIKAIPIGSLSEEPQESSNKIFKYTREHHTRKIAREKTNFDLMSRMLCNSDPKISSMRRQAGRQIMVMPEEAEDLFQK